MSEIFGDLPAAQSAYVELGGGGTQRVNRIFLNAGRKAARTVQKRPVSKVGDTLRFYLGDDVMEATQELYDRHYPSHTDDSSKDYLWKHAVDTGIVAGTYVAMMVPTKVIHQDRFNGNLTERIHDLNHRATIGYDVASVLQDGLLRDPLRQAALDMLPSRYVDTYAPGMNSLARDKQQLYEASLGMVAGLGLGIILESEFIAFQPHMDGAFDRRGSVKHFTRQLAALPEIPEPSVPPTEA